ncbi:phosphatase PAP2 family protein [Thermococcus sp. M39]|uniref:phosphatase PAP2 family protein n=1 Tax=unclassified Thermococcus TaxID=2627626 RepID=UPI0014392AFE|nr:MULTISPECIES: phosphatase PAP2 family protein [unclassified Thermococcus]NJE07310.1 phosphatase PAP2 family protein [Thermococcus sp. M39]NJE12558.1 phosphatase PAP2 family protein [Thermococcus sp. LS2]
MRKLDKALLTVSIFLLLSSILATYFQVYAFWKAITFLGYEKFYMILIPVIYLGYSSSYGITLFIPFILGMWLNLFLKNFFKLPRPPENRRLVEANGYGFPSGHAQGSSIVFGYFAYTKEGIGVRVFCLTMIALISLSRIVLGVHYWRDIFGGILLGVAVISLGVYLKNKIKYTPKVALLGIILSLLLPVISRSVGYANETFSIVEGSLIGAVVGYSAFKQLNLPDTSEIPLRKRAVMVTVGLFVSGSGYIAWKFGAPGLPTFALSTFTMVFLVPWTFSRLFDGYER